MTKHPTIQRQFLDFGIRDTTQMRRKCGVVIMTWVEDPGPNGMLCANVWATRDGKGYQAMPRPRRFTSQIEAEAWIKKRVAESRRKVERKFSVAA
ncbi:MAG: hypothetical protein AAFR84_01055 [Pseudomonadota bacterium]